MTTYSGDEFYDDEVTSGLDETDYRLLDVRREHPSDAVLDRLAGKGHARHGFCEKCWGDAYVRTLSNPSLTQGDHYHDILREVEL